LPQLDAVRPGRVTLEPAVPRPIRLERERALGGTKHDRGRAVSRAELEDARLGDGGDEGEQNGLMGLERLQRECGVGCGTA
ncbi:MAG TPA: hypothetical protein VKV69_13985, partial [Actinomycetota bacterium]|nr:hypothetical protein [Actinomycetota bacterium]